MTTPTEAVTPAHPHADPYPQRWWALIVLCTSLIVIALDNTILNIALPTLVEDLGASSTQLQWIVDAYVLVFAGLLLTMGALGDRFGRRGALGIGLAIFGTASVVSAFATTPGMLIATRSVMGVGGALIMPATLSIITNIFPPHERGRAIGIWAGVSGMGVAVGPLVGGWLLEHFWWGSVFLVNVPIVVIGLIGGRLIVPTSKDPHAPPLDPVGAVLSIAGLSALVYGIIEAPTYGWGDPVVLTAFLAAALLLGGFAWWEQHSDHPMLDVAFFRNPRFTAASLAITLVFFALFGSMFALTQYFQFVLGYTPLEAGTRLLPVALTMAVTAPLSARIVERIGTKRVVASGLVLVAFGLALTGQLGAQAHYGDIMVRLMLFGVGMGLTMAPSTDSIMGSLPLGKAGVGSAVNDTTRQVGGALGVATLGSLLASGYAGAMGDVVARLPADAAAYAKDSVGGALAVAAQAGDAGAALATAARGAFVDAMGTTLLVAAVVALVGAGIVLRFLPAREAAPAAARERGHGHGDLHGDVAVLGDEA